MKYKIVTNEDLEAWDIFKTDGLQTNEGMQDTLIATFFDKNKGFQYWGKLVDKELNKTFKETTFKNEPTWEIVYSEENVKGLHGSLFAFLPEVTSLLNVEIDYKFFADVGKDFLSLYCLCGEKKLLITTRKSERTDGFRCSVYKEETLCGE